jgi:hypothetical protein
MRYLMRYALSLLSASAAGLGGGVCAEIPDLSTARMQDVASHVFQGKVARIYSMVDRSTPQWETTHSVAELLVSRVEKGKHDGRLAYVRFWHKRFVGEGSAPPGSYGHRGIPKVGGSTRVFVVEAEDGGFDVLPPNGFTVMPGENAQK